MTITNRTFLLGALRCFPAKHLFLLIIHSPFHGGDVGLGVGVAAALIIFPFLYLAIFSNILKKVTT